MKFSENNNLVKWLYPFVQNEKSVGWIKSIITGHRTFSKANFCMRQNPELQHSNVAYFSTLERHEGGRRFMQNIYKSTSNITGSDPYWFQHKR